MTNPDLKCVICDFENWTIDCQPVYSISNHIICEDTAKCLERVNTDNWANTSYFPAGTPCKKCGRPATAEQHLLSDKQHARCSTLKIMAAFAHSRAATASSRLSDNNLLALIKDGERKDLTTLKSLPALKKTNPDEYKAIKSNLPLVMYSGFTDNGRRTRDSSYTHSGRVFVETDGVDFKAQFSQHPACVFAYTSVGGDGTHGVFAVSPRPKNDEEHQHAYAEVIQSISISHPDFQQSNDKSAKNIGRLAYLPYDPDCYVNLNATPIKWTVPPPVKYSPPSRAFVGDVNLPPINKIPVPNDYDDYFVAICRLKTAGYGMHEVEGWAATGAKYKQGEILHRWKGIAGQWGKYTSVRWACEQAGEAMPHSYRTTTNKHSNWRRTPR